jgi:hypothetical protein
LGIGAGSGEDVHIRGVGALSTDERKDKSWAKHSSSKGVPTVGTGVEEGTGEDFGAGAKEAERQKKGSNLLLRPKPRPTEVTEVELGRKSPGRVEEGQSLATMCTGLERTRLQQER